MKKIALLLVVVLVIASMSVLLFSCKKVAGKDYVLDSVTVTSDGGSSETIEQVKTSVENQYKDAVLSFTKDGKLVVTKGETTIMENYYVQDGSNIFVGTTADIDTNRDPDLVVEGKNLVWTMSMNVVAYTYTIKVTVVPKK